jgi:hypothetical protein
MILTDEPERSQAPITPRKFRTRRMTSPLRRSEGAVRKMLSFQWLRGIWDREVESPRPESDFSAMYPLFASTGFVNVISNICGYH